MKKYIFGLRAMAVSVGLMFALMHGEVVLGQEAKDTDLKSDAKLELRDQSLLKARKKMESLVRIKRNVLENIGTRRILLNDFESCIKSANSRENLKSCRNENKKGMEALRVKRKEMKEKMKAERGKQRKEMEVLRAEGKEMKEKIKAKRGKLRKEMEALRAEEKEMKEKMKGKIEKRRKGMN